jgi:hypothetical protein
MRRNTLQKRFRKTYKQVDIIFGTFALNEFPKLLFEAITNKKEYVKLLKIIQKIRKNII